jgi:hypothetical protein
MVARFDRVEHQSIGKICTRTATWQSRQHAAEAKKNTADTQNAIRDLRRDTSSSILAFPLPQQCII